MNIYQDLDGIYIVEWGPGDFYEQKAGRFFNILGPVYFDWDPNRIPSGKKLEGYIESAESIILVESYRDLVYRDEIRFRHYLSPNEIEFLSTVCKSIEGVDHSHQDEVFNA